MSCYYLPGNVLRNKHVYIIKYTEQSRYRTRYYLLTPFCNQEVEAQRVIYLPKNGKSFNKMSNPSLCGKINLVKEAKELYTVNKETLQSCNLNQKVSFYLEIEKLALRCIWKYKGPRVVFQLLWLYNKLPQNFIHRAKQSLSMLPDSMDQEFRQDTARLCCMTSVASAGRITGRRLESPTTFTHPGCLALG